MKSLTLIAAASVALAALTTAPAAHAQLSILAGGYVPASDVHSVTSGAQTVAEQRKGTLSLGANLELGFLRVSGAYASGTTIQNANRQDVGKGNVLGLAGDLVIRPLPRLLVQPYIVAGAGQKYYKYDENSTFTSGTSRHDFSLHGGLGADLKLGGLGVMAELTDFVSKDASDKWNVHDAFLMVGLKLGM
jgi:hypothetical protein